MLIQWMETFPTQIGGIWIKPGLNEVPDALRGDRVVRHFMNRGKLAIEAGAANPTASGGAPESTNALEKTLAGIKATFDAKILGKLRKGEKRPEVLEAIAAQLAEIQQLKNADKQPTASSGAPGADKNPTPRGGAPAAEADGAK